MKRIRIRKNKTDLSIEIIRLMENYHPISRTVCALILTNTPGLHLKLKSSSWELKRAWYLLASKGHIKLSGDRKNPDEHFAQILPRAYNFNPPIPPERVSLAKQLNQLVTGKGESNENSLNSATNE